MSLEGRWKNAAQNGHKKGHKNFEKPTEFPFKILDFLTLTFKLEYLSALIVLYYLLKIYKEGFLKFHSLHFSITITRQLLQGSFFYCPTDNYFQIAKDEVSYHRYWEAQITPSHIIDQSSLSYQVMDLFATHTLHFLLTLAFPLNFELLYEFFPSLWVFTNFSSMTSYINKWPI